MLPSRPIRQTPSRWEDIVGNDDLVRALALLIREIRAFAEAPHPLTRRSTEFAWADPSAPNSSAAIALFLRCIVCRHLDLETLAPCDGTCIVCCADPQHVGLEGLFAAISAREAEMPVNLITVVCARKKSFDPQGKHVERHWSLSFDKYIIGYAGGDDYVGKQVPDELFSRIVRQTPCFWIESTLNSERSCENIKHRSVSVETSVPVTMELAGWTGEYWAKSQFPSCETAPLSLAWRMFRRFRLPDLTLRALMRVQFTTQDGLTG